MNLYVDSQSTILCFLDNLKNLTQSVLNLKCVTMAITIVWDFKFLYVNGKPVLRISYSVLFFIGICSAVESLREIRENDFAGDCYLTRCY